MSSLKGSQAVRVGTSKFATGVLGTSVKSVFCGDGFAPVGADEWGVLSAFLAAGIVVSVLAARSQREARHSARLGANPISQDT